MNTSKRLNSVYKVMLSSFASKSEIEKEYRKCDEAEAKGLYLKVLTAVKEYISLGNIEDLKTLDKVVAVINETENKVTLKSYFESDENPIRNTNAIILACKHNQVDVLKYIFSSECKILDNLSTDIEIPAILPNGKDEECHNSFYYAIRSNNVQLLEALVEKWPNYFNLHLNKLDEILSKAYEELKLKHISLSDKIQIFVENTLINLRFFSETSENVKHDKPSFGNITERIRLVLENISNLSNEYSSSKEVNEKFLIAAKFIAQNIHILKRLLKSTYDRVPWEEMEFCLIVFIKSKLLKSQHNGNNQMCSYILTKKRILMHLENFAVQLNATKISKSYGNRKLPYLRREAVVANIIHSFPAFEQLYNDYEKVTDIYSLDKISRYVELALMVDPKEEEDRLMIIRVLQVIGEFLKNTLESPKLSCTTSELLLLSAPKNTSDILADLRNSLSHAHAVSKRMEIEKNGDIVFFTNIQNDLRKIGAVVADVLFRFKIKMCRTILQYIIDSTSLEEMREISQEFHFVEIQEPALQNFETSEHEKLKELIQKLSVAVNEKTGYEILLFSKINHILTAESKELTSNNINYVLGISMLKNVNVLINNNKTDSNTMKAIKSFTSQALVNIRPKMKPQSLKEIAEIAIEISSLAKPRLQPDNIDEVNTLMLQIFYVCQFEIDNIEWIGILREKLTKSRFSKICASVELKQTHTKLALNEQGSSQLKMKLSTLKNILNDNALDSQLIENYPSYKDNKKLQAAVEMLVQDIMSILGCSDYLTNNHFFLDNNSPLLIGKSLRNHLAHGNALIDILLFDPSIAIVSNASKLISETMSNNKKYIGKLVQDNPWGSKEKFERDLQIVVTQAAMFTAIEEGNFEDLKISIKNGADINAQNVNLQTALHFAAKGPNLEILKFVSAEITTSNDVDGKSPLHVAVACGNVSNVEFFLKEGFNINETNNDQQTPLHIAVQKGYKNVVELLLKNGAETNNKDASGFSPVHYSVTNNYKDITVILLEKETGVDVNESMGGYTLLHIAAEKGCFEIVLFLLRNKANVNAVNDRNWTPLHAAAVNGHFEIAQVLILNGADINAEVLTDGCTPLHYAVENGNENIVKLLLQNEANINAPNKIYNLAPLHYATKGGYVQIVEFFLRKKVNVHAVAINDMTPLHFAAESGHKEIVELLIKNKATIEAKSSHGFTALHLSTYYGFKDVVELLIRKGAKIHIKTKNGQTPLHFAGMSGNRDIVELLIAEQASVDAVDVFGLTTLHLSSISGRIDVMDTLIKKGAKINALDKENATPLHLVSGNYFKRIISEILLKCAPCAINRSTDDVHKKINSFLLGDDTEINGKEKGSERKVIKFLLDNGADVNTKCLENVTPLHLAALNGNAEVIDMLVKSKAKINVADSNGHTPLHLAVHGNHKKAVQILIENGANIDAEHKNCLPPLLFAIKHNYEEIVEVLLAKGADVSDESVLLAIGCGFKNIAESILKNKKINIKTDSNTSLLHLAAQGGFKNAVEALIKKGSDVNSLTEHSETPLYLAAREGHKEVIEILLENKANANVRTDEGLSSLHVAAAQGHKHVVEVLLNNGVNVEVKDYENRTAVELAISYGHFQVVKTLLQYKGIKVNAKGNDNWTVLHIASQAGNLDTVKLLLDIGADVNIRNTPGAKPVHIAARQGHKNILQFFLKNGCHIDDRGSDDSTLLHYAAIGGQTEIARYLTEQNVDVNVTDGRGLRPLHAAAYFGHEKVVTFLLSKGAIFNSVNRFHQTPFHLAKGENIQNILRSTEKLFKAVKHNMSLAVENLIKAGACIDAKSIDNVMPLHCAAWKGYTKVVGILLKAQANPNVVGKSGCTPLHYATKYSHFGIVKALLSNGAIYNSSAINGKTPLNFAEHREIINLLKLIEQAFDKIQNGDPKIIGILKQIKDIDIMKAIMNARNGENKTLMVTAIQNNFSEIEGLKQMLQGDVNVEIGVANLLLSQEKFQESLNIFQYILAKREQIFGPDNPATLEIQDHVAKVLYAQKKYQESLDMLEKIYKKQKEILGIDSKDALKARSSIALILHRQGKNKDALKMYQRVYKKQKEILGNSDPDTLETQFHMALVLHQLGKFEEALSINYEVFEKKKLALGENDPRTLIIQINIAMVLSNLGKHEEAMKTYRQVYEKRQKVLGFAHSDCLRPLYNIATVLMQQKKYDGALKALQEVFELQQKHLGSNHLDTLDTECNIANIFFQQGKWLHAFKAYKSGFKCRKAILGPNHPSIIETLAKLEVIEFRLKFEGNDISEINKLIQN